MDNGQLTRNNGQRTIDNNSFRERYPLSIIRCPLIIILLLIGYVNFSFAQDAKPKTKIHAGYAFYLNYNLYSWYQKNSRRSSGQVFNVLPGIGFNLWVGNVDNWIVALEGGVEYLPFALDLNAYEGFGALGFPMMAKFQTPVAKQQSLWLMVHAGLGAQIQNTNLHGRYILSANPFFTTIVGELGFHISAVGYQRQHIREIEFFVRVGGAPLEAVSFNTGLRLTFWKRF